MKFSRIYTKAGPSLHIALWRINVLQRRGHRSNLDCLLPSTVEQLWRIRVYEIWVEYLMQYFDKNQGVLNAEHSVLNVDHTNNF